jgi:hypothetical protein
MVRFYTNTTNIKPCLNQSPPVFQFDLSIGFLQGVIRMFVFNAMQRGFALGAKHGLKGLAMFNDPTVDTPAVGEDAMSGAVGIVVTLAAVIITLYITAIIVGSMSKTTTGLALPTAWNTTITALDTQAQSSFSLSGIIPIAIVGVGILTIIIGAFAMQ